MILQFLYLEKPFLQCVEHSTFTYIDYVRVAIDHLVIVKHRQNYNNKIVEENNKQKKTLTPKSLGKKTSIFVWLQLSFFSRSNSDWFFFKIKLYLTLFIK